MTSPPEAPGPLVLVALDGSPAAATALPVARVVAAQLGAAVSILHVTSESLLEASGRKRLHLDRQPLAGEVLRILRGADPGAALLNAAADPNVVLLVLTTHGRTIEPGRRLGRVAEQVIAATARPILLIRPEAAVARPARAMRRLLVPDDGALSTALALKPAGDLADRLGASIDLLSVTEAVQAAPQEAGARRVPRYVDQPQHEWPQWAQEALDRLRRCAECPGAVPVRVFLAVGDAGHEIGRFAAEHDTDAIVLVRRSRLEPGRAAVLRAVLDRAPCPVLLVSAGG